MSTLKHILGCDNDEQITQIIQKEPDLLQADNNYLVGRLLNMRQLITQDVNLLDLIKRYPTLLLQQPEVVLCNNQDKDQLMRSWKFGIFDDRDIQWQNNFKQLKAYKKQIGDAHTGFRDEDPIQLVRWTNKQRSDYNHSYMKENRIKNLQLINFEFDVEKAEWQCWFNELKKYGERLHLGSQADMRITNWCSVQRVARKCCVLQQERVDMLNSIGFDWAAADALS